MGVPSSICRGCHLFLNEYETRKERYSRVEQMFMELLRAKNNTCDTFNIRAKYNLNKEEKPLQDSFNENQQLDENVEYNQDHEQLAPRNINSITAVLPVNLSPEKSVVVQAIPKDSLQTVSKTAKQPLIILNPTIHCKIRSINRIALFKCDLCAHTNSTKLSMERHMKQIHLKSSAVSFQCETCSKTFAKKVLWQNHQNIHMAHRPTYDCEHCGKVLSSKTAVASHIKWLHKDKKEFQCLTCTKMFPTVSSTSDNNLSH